MPPSLPPVRANHSRRKNLLLGLGVMSFATLLLLGAGEWLCRRGFEVEKRAAQKMKGSPIGLDRTFGFKGIPGFDGIAGGVRVSINGQGFRDENWEEKLRRAAAHPDQPRILLLGDSMTYGYFISKDFRLSEQLLACYRSHTPGAEIFNAAIPGYGPAEQMRVLEQYLPIIKPTHILLRYCANDFGDSALPYDYRSPNRVYRPWYTLDGRLALNERVPRRFSMRVRDTMFDHLDLKYAIDRLQYTLDDIRYQKLGIYSDLGIDPSDKEHRVAAVAHLGYLALDAKEKPVFQKQKARALALWSRMRDLARDHDATFLMLGTIDAAGAGGEPALLADFAERQLPFLNYHDLLAPWQPWAYVEGDGHPNLVDNYVVATTLFNRMEKRELSIDFHDASWLSKIPRTLVMTGNREEQTLRWGPWGRIDHRARAASTGSRVLLRNPVPDGPVEVLVSGRMPATTTPQGKSAPLSMRLHLPDCDSETLRLPDSGAFECTFHFASTHFPLLFLQIELPDHPASGKTLESTTRTILIQTISAAPPHDA